MILAWLLAMLVANATAIAVVALTQSAPASAAVVLTVWTVTLIVASYLLTRVARVPWWDRSPRPGSVWAALVMVLWMAGYLVLGLNLGSGQGVALTLAWFTAAVASTEAARWAARHLTMRFRRPRA